MACRDWLATLWSASYKGVPFFVDKDDESGGRRIVIHEFPNRDDPFLEDLGEAPRLYEVTAYVASDTADRQADVLVAAFASIDAGTLVLPAHGPIEVRCTSFGRDRSKDRHGYIGFKAKFVRAAAAAAPAASVASLQNAVVSLIDGLASIVGGVFAIVADVVAVVDFVFDAIVSVIDTVAAVVDAIVSVATVVADVAELADFIVAAGETAYDVFADVRDAASDLVADIPDYLSRTNGATPEYAERVFEMVRDLGAAMPPRDAVTAFAEAIARFPDQPVPADITPNEQAAIRNANEASRVFRIAALSAYTEAAIRVAYPSRQEGVTARADLVELYEAEIEALAGARHAPIYVELIKARNAAVDMLSRTITDLAPVITVSAPVSMPSLFWSWRLYQDPTRAGEIVSRNNVIHPSFCPTTFEALAR